MEILKKIRNRFGTKTLSNNEIISNWEKSGKPLPPPHAYKQQVISEYKLKYNIETFVETGTYLGEMVEAQLKNFKQIFSIELGKDLYENAVKKFSNEKHVTIIEGDSGKVLNDIMRAVKTSAIFWLDGHYSEGITAKGEKVCPIYEELGVIFNAPALKHVLLVDDARLFDGTNDYPSKDELIIFIKKHKPAAEIDIDGDIIRVVL